VGLNFVKKANTGLKPAAKAAEAPWEEPAEDEAPSPKKKPLSSKASGSVKAPSWMKTGSNAQAAMQHAEAQAEKAKEEAGKMWRFWMPPEEERKITFLDGDIGDDGMLAIPMFYEHRVKLDGKWQNFVCVAEQEPCPLCESGESKQTLVGVLTCIDHTVHKIAKGPNAGKSIQNSRKLYVVTRNTIKILSKIAIKKGGLTGCTFDVSRTGDKEPSVGNQFDFVEKLSFPALMKKYDLKAEDVSPADVGDEIIYRSAEELEQLGLGKSQPAASNSKVSAKGLKGEL